MTKTNALRLLDTAGISYDTAEYEYDENDLSGSHLAKQLGLDPDCVFKTLVCVDERGEHKVFCIPVEFELDLKKCAVVCGSKRVEMIHVKELLPLTGYMRGGCSPLGMKKKFPTFIDETAILFDRIYINAGALDTMVLVEPTALIRYMEATEADLVD